MKKAEETLNITTKKYQGTVASYKEFNEKNKRAIELFSNYILEFFIFSFFFKIKTRHY